MDRLPRSMAPKLWAAADVFARQGLDATKMEQVAEVTGIPKATLYYHFASKEAVLAWIFGELLAEVQQAVMTAAQGEDPVPVRLRRVLHEHLLLFHRRRMASKALQFDLGRAARSPRIVAAADASFIAPVGALIAAGVEEGTLKTKADPRALAIALLGSINSTGMQLPAQQSEQQLRAAADVLADLFLNGLKA